MSIAAGDAGTPALREALQEVRATPEKPERLARESQLLFYLAESIPESQRQEKQATYEAGREAAEKARKASPQMAAALLWWSANQGGLARLKRNLWGLGALKEIEKVLTELKKIDPAHGFAAAFRVLGKIYLEAPGFISIGSSSRAEKHLKEAVHRSPEFPANQLGLAEYYLDEGERTKALEIARQVQTSLAKGGGEYGDFKWELPQWQERIDAILKKAGGLDR